MVVAILDCIEEVYKNIHLKNTYANGKIDGFFLTLMFVAKQIISCWPYRLLNNNIFLPVNCINISMQKLKKQTRRAVAQDKRLPVQIRSVNTNPTHNRVLILADTYVTQT